MKKKTLFFIIFTLITLFNIQDTYAYSIKDHINRQLCGSFEVAEAKADGSLVTQSCHPNYDQATIAMHKDGRDNLVVLGGSPGNVKIYDATTALVDFSTQSGIFSMYNDIELKDEFTYMIGESRHGASDGMFYGTGYSSYRNTFVYNVKIGGYRGWIRSGYIEIVPLVWVKSTSTYTVTNESIRHNYVSKIQNANSGIGGNTIGPKPDMLSPGDYYSYDGHYFYKNLEAMVKDYQAGHYNNAVNKDKPYYNYYQYLPNHTKTSYSSINIDEYIRNNLGFGRDVFGTTALTKNGIKSSRLYGKGTFFYNAQEVYGVNALLALGLSRNETGNGTSNLAINKNNGFGLNAVDSSPTESANWYAAFSSSILGYANKWVTYGYSKPTDWRYFGGQYGNKNIGMNVKYASDVYWSEKMASNYYSVDRALSLQDYNYYQLGITNFGIEAKLSPNSSSRTVYNFRSPENSVVIVDEVEGTPVNGNNKWYKVVSDLNIDSNGNAITSGPYNWNTYVYVPAAYITKINTGYNGYISPTEVTPYQDKDYTYDIYTNPETMKLAPKVAISTKETMYYYDPTLLSAKGQTLLKNRYVMVFTTAYNKDKQPVAYLVTSDYKYDQKHWVSADSIRFTSSRYGQASVTVPNTNTYTIINPDTVDSLATHISGLYHYNYVPILEERNVDGYLWYKVPVDLSGNNLEFGWTLASAPDVKINVYEYKSGNTAPVIYATDKTIIQGTKFDATKDVTAYDNEDGPLPVRVANNEVKEDIPGTYNVTYEVTDKNNQTITKTITVTVVKDEEPVINATNIEMRLGAEKPNLLANVSATDKEDGPIKEITVDDSKVNYTEVGEYPVIYKVKDSYGHEVEKTVYLKVLENEPPVIHASDKTITINSEFNEREGVTATDYTGKDITESIQVIKNDVKPETLGTYEVTYQVTDSNNKTTTKTIKVTVTNKTAKESLYYFDSLKEVNSKLQIKGYHAIKGIDHLLNEEFNFYLVFENLADGTRTKQEIERITDKLEMNRPIFSTDGKDYTYSWFKGNINIDELADGDYELYIVTENKDYFAETKINNKVLKEQVTEYTSKKTVTTRNNYRDPEMPLQLIIRSKKIAEKTANSVYNQYTQFRTLAFENNKLHIMGTAYSIGMDLAPTKEVKRQLIFENQANHKTYSYDLASITDGLYTVGTTLGDNLDKTRAWFDKSIDITNIPEGTYTIYIATQSNVKDYSELEELLQRDLSNVVLEANGRKYTFKVNSANRYRVELIVKGV